MPEKGNCRTCKAPVLWVKTAATNSPMPLDADPVEGGNIYLVDGMAHYVKGGLFDEQPPEGPRYVSHFSTCPDAKAHRKKK